MTTPTTVIGVCGFGRCGSTMVMRMLDAGGVRAVEGSAPISYELANLEPAAFHGLELHHRSVKLLDAVLHQDLPAADWRFVWLDRRPRQQARSAAKFLEAMAGVQVNPAMERSLAKSYARDRPWAITKLRRLGQLHVTSFENVLARPAAEAERLAQFLAPEISIDAAAAAAAVHDRTPECRPDLAFEFRS